MLKKSIIIFFLLLSKLISAQGFKVKEYISNSLNNTSKTIFEIAPRQYIGGGFTIDPLLGTRLSLTGIDTTGHIKWIKHYGDTSFQHVDNFLITRYFMKHGNNLYYTGALRDKNPRAFGILMKFNFNGDTLWQKIFRSADTLEDLIPQRVTASVDGGFLITGWFQYWGSNSSRKLLILKTDANGNELWRKQINKGNPNVQDGKGIIQDSATKKIAIVGYQYLVTNTGFNTYDNIVILDSLGNYIASTSRIFGLGGALLDLIQTKDKKLVACGYKIVSTVNGGSTNLYKSYALKFDFNNPYSPIWTIDDFDVLNPGNGFSSVDELPNGDLIFGGGIDTGAYSIKNSFQRIAKFDKDGSLIYKKYYNYKTNSNTIANAQGMMSLLASSDGGMLAAFHQSNSNPNPFFFVKYDANGCDTTLAYCNTLLFDNVLPKENSLFTVFPNPAHDFIYLQFIGQQSKHLYKITITNCIGELQLNLNVNPRLQNNQIVNIGLLKSGIYLLQLWENDKMISTQKLIKN